MVEAKGEFYWAPWGVMLSMFANANRDIKKRRKPFTTKDFNPYEKKTKKKQVDMTVSMKDLKNIFMGMKYK